MLKRIVIYFVLITNVSCSQNTNKEQIFFEDFSLKSEGVILNGKKEGEWNYYDEKQHNYAIITYKADKKEGKAKYFYEDGSVAKITNYKNDTIKVGEFKEFYTNGKQQSYGNYDEKGEKVGEWKWFYENGKIEIIGTYNKENERVGKWEWYFENGKLEEQKFYTENNKPTGIWVEYRNDGSLYSKADFNKQIYEVFYDDKKTKAVQGTFKNSEPHGKWLYYHKDGTIRGEINYVEGQLKGDYFFQNEEKKIYKKFTHLTDSTFTGNYIEYYENGNLKFQREYDKKGNAVGIWESYFENGKMESRKQYDSNNKAKGEWKEYFSNGQLKVVTEFPNGKHKVYNENGVLMIEGKMKNYKSYGKWKKYFVDGDIQAISNYPNGKHIEYDYRDDRYIKAKGGFKDSKEEGKWTFFHSNGAIDEEGQMSNGKKEGEWKMYYNDGTIFKSSIYRNNKIISEEYYVKEGNKVYINLRTKVNQEGDYECEKYYPTGELLATGKAEAINLRPIERWEYFSKEGKITVIEYISPLYITMRKEFYDNGNLKSIKFYDIGGIQIGKYREFDTNGKLKKEGIVE